MENSPKQSGIWASLTTACKYFWSQLTKGQKAIFIALATIFLTVIFSLAGGTNGKQQASTSTSPTATASTSAPVPSPTTEASTTTAPAPSQEPTTATAEATVALADEPQAQAVPAAATADGPEAQAAWDLLETLPVKGRAPKTGYDRDLFGHAWADTDHNGCDTRNDILRRDLTNVTVKAGTNGCQVTSGTLNDPYTGQVINFVRGQETSKAVQIDHVVALSDAWQTGAQGLDEATRTAFANDPENLLAVDGPANQQKGDGDAATWLPANSAYRCTYVAKQIQVKAKYGLWVKQAEKDAMQRVLANCGASAPAAPAPVVEEPAPAAPAPVEQAPVAPAPAPGAGVSYPNCAAVKAAGAAPIYAGQPGYSSKLDRGGR